MADPVPKTRFNAPVSAHRTIDALSYDLAELKQIQAAIPGATVNDIALAIAGGALRAYLAEYDELPEPSLVAVVPISTRLPTDGPSGNRISLMLAPIGTNIANPVERVAAVAAATRAPKERAQRRASAGPRRRGLGGARCGGRCRDAPSGAGGRLASTRGQRDRHECPRPTRAVVRLRFPFGALLRPRPGGGRVRADTPD
jgi:hypothetical protein